MSGIYSVKEKVNRKFFYSIDHELLEESSEPVAIQLVYIHSNIPAEEQSTLEALMTEYITVVGKQKRKYEPDVDGWEDSLVESKRKVRLVFDNMPYEIRQKIAGKYNQIKSAEPARIAAEQKRQQDEAKATQSKFSSFLDNL